MAQSWDLTPAGDAWKPAGQATNAFSAPVVSGIEHRPYRMAMWRGLPGRYERPNGMPWSETFVVYTGAGSIQFRDERVELKPGTVVHLRKGVPYTMEISATLEKMAVVVEGDVD